MASGEAQLLELPHTRGCVVCGRDNPLGLGLSLFVNPATGAVRVNYTPRAPHIGFEDVVHGGVLATVIDEAMVWAATWAGKRFCLCGEMTVRYRLPAAVGRALVVEARVESARPRLIQTVAEIRDGAGEVVASATGKYVPLPPHRNREFVATLINEPATAAAARSLQDGSPEP
jgi:acyl-coenzyme A thioesterase PaaI-like protein